MNAIAALWGLAEATVFFIVPDVWLTVAGRRDLRRGLFACLFALAGALAGGALMYGWGARDAAAALRLIETLPAIDAAMVVRVEEALRAQGLHAMVLGPLSGTPYKIYAVHAGAAGIDWWLFLLLSVPARIIRFVGVTVVAHYALRVVAHLQPAWNPLLVLVVGWSLFYAGFFASMPG